MTDDDLLKDLQTQADQRRRHAPFFSWHDRSPQGRAVAEVGIVRALLEAMQAMGSTEYLSARASGESWPDAWLSTAATDAVPCEVTEFVDQAAMPAGQPRPWTSDEIRSRLQAILSHKEKRTLGSGVDQKSVLVIHTDEFYLNADNVGEALEGAVFRLNVASIGKAFFLLSYDPNRGGYRYFDLQIAP